MVFLNPNARTFIPSFDKTADYSVTGQDSGNIFTNTGASAVVVFTLPDSPQIGWEATFIVNTPSKEVRIKAGTGAHYIQTPAGDSRAGSVGYGLSASYVGSMVRVCYIATNVYQVIAVSGRWLIVNTISTPLYGAGAYPHGINDGQADIRVADRWAINDSGVGDLTDARERFVARYFERGQVITNIGMVTGGTGMGTPTHYHFTLRNSAHALLANTADQTTTAWATYTEKVLALTSAFTCTYSGIHYVGIAVKATTPARILTIGAGGSEFINADETPVFSGEYSDVYSTTPVATGTVNTSVNKTCIWTKVT